MAEHTPGQWTVVGPRILNPSYGTVFQVRYFDSMSAQGQATATANLRLGAAAPAMLATLRLVQRELRSGVIRSLPIIDGSPDDAQLHMRSLDEIVAEAIEAATGASA